MCFKALWLVLVAVVLVAAPPAGAVAPDITTAPFDRTRVIAASADTCPFDIQVHSTGTFRFVTFFDADGNVTKQMTTVFDFHIEWSNPLTGKALTTPLAGPVIVEPYGEGTVLVTVNGNDARFVVPGVGIVFGAVGRLVYVAPENDLGTALEILQSTGHQDLTPFPAVCAGLA